MSDFRISEESKKVLEARLESKEGQAGLDRFVDLIVEWSVSIMTPEQRECFMTPQGLQELKKMWPDIVNGYFRHLCGPPQVRKHRTTRKNQDAGSFGQPDKEAEYARLLAVCRARLPD